METRGLGAISVTDPKDNMPWVADGLWATMRTSVLRPTLIRSRAGLRKQAIGRLSLVEELVTEISSYGAFA